MWVQPALSLKVTTPLASSDLASSSLASSDHAEKLADGFLNHQQAAASIGISPGLLNCYVAIYRSLGGQLPVKHAQQHKQQQAGFARRYDPELVAGFAGVRQHVREGADIRSAMAALQLRQQDAKATKSRPTKKRDRAKLEQLLELNAQLSQKISELRSELSAIKQHTAPSEDNQQDRAA